MFKRLRGQKVKATTDNETQNSLRKTIEDYIGYDDVKDRAKTDKGLRNFLYTILLDLIDTYSIVQNQLMQAQLLSTWSASNAILAMLNELRNLLTTDVYRHSTFFETPNVSENLEISVLYLLESETILTIKDVKENMLKVSQKLTDLDLFEIERDIFVIRDNIEEVKLTISDRAELIASFEIVGI
ncbi:MAG: hypothetical protein ACXAD7_14440 [Candidatus Kariarchaeaceae archaeon]|jgi:hypothetical protein